MIEILTALGGMVLALIGAVVALFSKLQSAKRNEKNANDALGAFHKAQEAQNDVIKKQNNEAKNIAETIANHRYFGE